MLTLINKHNLYKWLASLNLITKIYGRYRGYMWSFEFLEEEYKEYQYIIESSDGLRIFLVTTPPEYINSEYIEKNFKNENFIKELIEGEIDYIIDG